MSYDDGTGYSEWTYNSSNLLVSGTTGLGGMDAPGAGISYDASGNLTAFGGMTLTYDAIRRPWCVDRPVPPAHSCRGDSICKHVLPHEWGWPANASPCGRMTA